METKAWITQIKKGTLEMCILCLLAQQERYGYELIQDLNGIGDVMVSEGTVYPLLKRLKAEGLVESLEGITTRATTKIL